MKEAGLITAIASLMKAMDGWEFSALLLVLVVMPVLVTLLITRSNRELREEIQEDRVSSDKRLEALRIASDKRFEALSKASERRFEAVVRMYENNAELVERYEKVAGDLTTMIHLCTRAMTKTVDKVELTLKLLEQKDMSLKMLQIKENGNG